MKRFFTVLVALAAASSFAQGSNVLATTPRISILVSPKVQTELAMDAIQKERLEAVFKKVAASGGKGIMITTATDVKPLEREATEILKPEQRSRLEQIWLQYEGGLGLTDPEIAKKLALTEDQRKRIAALVAGKARIGARPCREETGKEILALLSNEQREKFEAMKGSRFNFELKTVRARRDGG